MAPFDLNELKGRANAARTSLAHRVDGVKTSVANRNKPPEEQSDSVHITAADKQPLFNLLDAYFERRRNPSTIARAANSPKPPVASKPPQPPVATRPPPVNSSTRPAIPPSAPSHSSVSHPTPQPATSNADDCEALKLAQFFSPTTSWSAYPEWFAFDRLAPGTQPTPPPLLNREIQRSTSWSYHGNEKTLNGIALFEDLSITWYHLTWNDPRSVRREVRWSAPPSPWGGSELYVASSTYGDLVAEFAERAEASRTHVGRGECWDLANDGLREVGELAESSGGFAKPMPCVGRTHGHLLFSATAGQTGVWRGGENAIRRGDIVQWLSVKIKLVGQPNVTMTLGQPDHTAIVVADTAVSGIPEEEGVDGLRLLDASCIGPLEVVEQSARELPTRRTYDMSQFMSGQVSCSEL